MSSSVIIHFWDKVLINYKYTCRTNSVKMLFLYHWIFWETVIQILTNKNIRTIAYFVNWRIHEDETPLPWFEGQYARRLGGMPAIELNVIASYKGAYVSSSFGMFHKKIQFQSFRTVFFHMLTNIINNFCTNTGLWAVFS